jgi:hypothetical protein
MDIVVLNGIFTRLLVMRMSEPASGDYYSKSSLVAIF